MLEHVKKSGFREYCDSVKRNYSESEAVVGRVGFDCTERLNLFRRNSPNYVGILVNESKPTSYINRVPESVIYD